ncbi:protein kinase [Halothiobacillus diazotrophicus]|uniref:Protein kinase n=1 Tax=Halothiobacillus diazotrophicus TaxID=1860122 RepID=A0A191ZFE7_9GAMM|nr:bifunctional protein-serine/threonine kinase/phosphatase [Halothiobacillus diazotrophicus]ANJ66577.1 protein kinase [Halothiobacillus diazotrophicus]
MSNTLKISAGQYSDKGRKDINQDFHGLVVPKEPLLGAKGIALALADGISSSQVSQIASQAAVRGFLADYYSTSEAWSVKTSAERVLIATNAWLHAQTQQSPHRYDKDRGYVCTLSALILKSTTAHLFHIGDTRIYRINGDNLEQLTQDHRIQISAEKSYLSQAMGVDPQLKFDYLSLPAEVGDVFVLATDGVYEHLDARTIVQTIRQAVDSSHEQRTGEPDGNLDTVAQNLVEQALAHGSTDNLTLQIVRIDALPPPEANEFFQKLVQLPLPPKLEPRTVFDGYQIVRALHNSHRSHVYLAVDTETDERVVIKTPAVDLREDQAYLESFLMAEWVARRIDNAHVLKPAAHHRPRSALYVVTEYIEGQTLAQWLIDHPKPNLDSVRDIVEQIAKGLQAFHRLEMVHRDLKPGNFIIDGTGTVKIIDFGTTSVAGLQEIASPIAHSHLQGEVQYAAPEYLLGEPGTARSDIFSLGVIAYEMLSGGKLPYGAQAARANTRGAQRRLKYRSLRIDTPAVPLWIDEAIRKAVHPNPLERYEVLSEFMHDLRTPNRNFLIRTRPPLMERNPVLFWKGVSLILAALVAILLIKYVV